MLSRCLPVLEVSHGEVSHGEVSQRQLRQCLLVDLVGSGEGKFLEKPDSPGMLIGGTIEQRVLLELLFGNRVAWPGDDKGHRFPPLDFIWNRHDAGLLNARVALQHSFHFARVDVLTAAYEHVVGAPHKIEEPVLITAENVAGYVVAVRRERRAGEVRQIVIFVHQGWTLDLQYAFPVQTEQHLSVWITQRAFGRSKTIGMGSEADGACFSGAVDVADLCFGKLSA